MQDLVVSANGSITVTRVDGVALDSACDNETGAFSAAELLAASLGSCIAASITPLLSRHGGAKAELHIVLRPAGTTIAEGFAVTITLPEGCGTLQPRCARAANACPVRRALNVPVSFHWQEC